MNNRNTALLLLIFFVSAGGFLCLVAAACGLAGSLQVDPGAVPADSASLNIFFLGTAWIVLLLIPGAGYAIQRIQNAGKIAENPRPSRLSGWLPFLGALVLYPVILLLGNLVSRNALLLRWALPLLHILAATIPVFVLSRLALYQLNAGSALRRWGIFGLGLVLGPGLIMVIEMGLLFIVAIGFLFQIASDQSQAMELMLLAQRLQFAQADPETILRILRPYLSNPLIPFGAFLFIAAIVPLVEEFLKPIGVWLLAGRDITPAEGFTAGVLSGAGYALFENLFITLPGSEWALVSLGRIGTTTMHMLTAGITGYALANAWQHSRFIRLGLLFTSSVFIHAVWNGLTLLSVGGTFTGLTGTSQQIQSLGQVAPVGLIVLYLAVLVGLVGLNRRLRRSDSLSHAIIPGLLMQGLSAGELTEGDDLDQEQSEGSGEG